MGSGTGLDMRAEDALGDSSVITAVNVLGTGPDGDWLTSISSFLSTTYKCFTFTADDMVRRKRYTTDFCTSPHLIVPCRMQKTAKNVHCDC